MSLCAEGRRFPPDGRPSCAVAYSIITILVGKEPSLGLLGFGFVLYGSRLRLTFDSFN